MSSILDLLKSDLGKQIVTGVANSTGNDASKTSSVLSLGLPVLLKAMERNVKNNDADGLMNALENKHDGSILDNLSSLFSGGVDDSVKQDGSGILNHILGNKQSGISKIIADKVGLDASAVSNILKIAAPILLGFLGKQKKEQNIGNSQGLTSLLGGVMNNNSKESGQSFITQILDADGDGSMIDDISGMLLGGKKDKSEGIGGMLGGFFK